MVNTRTVVPASLAHVYIKDFGGNHAAASEYAGISVYALKRCLQATLVEEWQAEALLKACYRRLGNAVTDRILHPAEVAMPSTNGTTVSAPVMEAPTVESGTEATTEVAPETAPLVVLKQCARCKNWKAATPENFGRNPNTKDGLQGMCLACLHEVSAKGGRTAQANARAKIATATTPEAPTPVVSAPISIPRVVLYDAPVSGALLALAADVEKLENEVVALRLENDRLRSWSSRMEALLQEMAALKAGA